MQKSGLQVFSIVFFLFFCLGWETVVAQTVNGQFFTPGLVIVNSPAVGNPTTVGSVMPISLDVSGDGLLPFPYSTPASSNDLPTAILSLEIFLVSGHKNINITVSEGPDLLDQEPGSTVKHVNFQVPQCIPGGDYNLTFYEVDRINEITFFAIYPIPVYINRPSGSSNSCVPNSRDAEYQPQSDNRSPIQPFSGPGQENFNLVTSKAEQSKATSTSISAITTAIKVVTTVLVPTVTQSGGEQITTFFPQQTVIASDVVIAAPAESQGDFGVPLFDGAAAGRTVSLLLPISALSLWFLLANDVS